MEEKHLRIILFDEIAVSPHYDHERGPEALAGPCYSAPVEAAHLLHLADQGVGSVEGLINLKFGNAPNNIV
jgi:hypothetical protein